MSWKKHFKLIQVGPKVQNINPPSSHYGKTGEGVGSANKFSSFLPEFYAGHPNRIQRYAQYEDMDRDSDINIALDTIADFCTQSEEQTDSPFNIDFSDDTNETEIDIINKLMTKWIKTNDFRSRLWYIFRGVLKNGDQFFLRDPETKEWLWIDHFNVEMVKVDESQGRKPIEYMIRNLDLNQQAKYGTKPSDAADFNKAASNVLSRGPVGAGTSASNFQLAGTGVDPRNGNPQNKALAVEAKHVIHLSLSVGMDINWPFGRSILESVFKTFKQKELLEDAVIMYRVQRAPERRIFYIDTGDMNPMMANAYVERLKNEIHQRRIPNRTGGSNNIMDAAYNPLSMMEDYFFAQSSDGRGSRVETLSGGDQLGEITDLELFNKKLRDGLGIPAAYMPGSNNETATYNDGKMGAALIQEFKFNKMCIRMQNLLAPVFDEEFKQFLKDNGIQIEDDLFELKFNPPQNFTKYRQIELDQAQMAVYTQIVDNKRLSERFKLQRYLNLTEEEIQLNEKLWAEENPVKVKTATGVDSMDAAGGGGAGDGLSAVGVTPSGGDDGGDDESLLDFDTSDTGDGADTGASDTGGGEGGEAPAE